MKYIIEIIIIAIFSVFAIIGLKCGFVKLAAKPVKFLLAIVLAFSLSSVVSEQVVTPIIEEPLTNYVSDFLYSNCEDLTGENLSEELPTLLKIAAVFANMDIEDGSLTTGEEVIEGIVESLIDPVIDMVSVIIAFIAVYFLSKIALWIIFGLINSLFKKGIFGVLNRILGFVFSGFVGVVAAWGFAVITELVIHVPALVDTPLIASFEGGFLYNFFNTYNPMELLLSF